MRKKYIKSPFATVWLIYLVCLTVIILHSCRKTDKVENLLPNVVMLSELENKFFNNNKPEDPLVMAVKGFLQRKNDSLKFVEKTVSQIGYPYWNKSVVVAGPNSNTGGRGNSGDSINITYVPFVRDSQNYVNASLLVKTTPTDTVFRYLCDWEYATIDSTQTVWDARDVFHVFSMLDKNVFNRNRFRITDENLLTQEEKDYLNNTGLPFDSAVVIYTLQPTQSSGRGNNILVPIEICDELLVCIEPALRAFRNSGTQRSTIVPACPSGQTPFVFTLCTTVMIEIPGGGGGSGGSGGGSGGSSGGGGTGGVPPECVPGSSRSFVVNPCEPGWVPIPPDEEPPSDTLINPCAHANVVAADPQFKAMLQDLKSHSDNPIDTTEHSWVYVDSPTGYSMGSNSGEPGEKELNLNTSIPIDGLAHNHFVNSLSIFSPDDLWTLCKLFKDKLIVDSSKFTLPLVTAEGTQYMLMIENITKFRYWSEKFVEGELDGYYDLFKKIFFISKDNTINSNEKNFLKYLNKTNGGSGLKVFRGNTNFNEWTPLGLDENNNVITSPCL